MRKPLALGGIIALLLVATMALSAIGSGALSSDTETSLDNSFTAGTLNLTVNDTADGQNTVQYTVDGMEPGSQINSGWGAFTLHNTGNLAGYVDIHSITVASQENGITEPEVEAGDTTPDVGELQNLLNVRLWVDTNGDGWMSDGEAVIYDGKVKDLPATGFDQNVPLAPGGSVRIGVLFDWWSQGAADNLAQGDTCTLGLTFELGQTAAQ